MKSFLLLSLFSLTLLAASLPKVTLSFSLHEREILLKEFLHSTHKSTSKCSDSLSLKKGWNILITSKDSDGIDVLKTFSNQDILELVATYESVNKKWAVHSFHKLANDEHILNLIYIEPNVPFFVLAKKDAKIKIFSHKVNEVCQALMNDDKYGFKISSVFDKSYVTNDANNASFTTRYLTNQEKGIYNDTRTMFIYPKINSKSEPKYKYGPAQPKVAMKFAKEYEGQVFYVYDYKYQKCYKGLFPSMKIPPFPILQEIK